MSTKDLAKIAAAQKQPDTLRNALANGGPLIWCSALVMGLANMAAGQFIKGLIFLAIEIGVIAFMCIPGGGAYWLGMMPAASFTLPVITPSRSCCMPLLLWFCWFCSL